MGQSSLQKFTFRPNSSSMQSFTNAAEEWESCHRNEVVSKPFSSSSHTNKVNSFRAYF